MVPRALHLSLTRASVRRTTNARHCSRPGGAHIPPGSARAAAPSWLRTPRREPASHQRRASLSGNVTTQKTKLPKTRVRDRASYTRVACSCEQRWKIIHSRRGYIFWFHLVVWFFLVRPLHRTVGGKRVKQTRTTSSMYAPGDTGCEKGERAAARRGASHDDYTETFFGLKRRFCG
jgi:hypothetical protein